MKTRPQSGYLHSKNSLVLCVSGFLTLMVRCHSLGIPLKVFEPPKDFSGLLSLFSNWLSLGASNSSSFDVEGLDFSAFLIALLDTALIAGSLKSLSFNSTRVYSGLAVE